jgi:hypothetical protein
MPRLLLNRICGVYAPAGQAAHSCHARARGAAQRHTAQRHMTVAHVTCTKALNNSIPAFSVRGHHKAPDRRREPTQMTPSSWIHETWQISPIPPPPPQTQTHPSPALTYLGADVELAGPVDAVLAGYDHVRQHLGCSVQLLQGQAQVRVVDGVVLCAVVDVRDLGDVVLLLLVAEEGFQQLAPPVCVGGGAGQVASSVRQGTAGGYYSSHLAYTITLHAGGDHAIRLRCERRCTSPPQRKRCERY